MAFEPGGEAAGRIVAPHVHRKGEAFHRLNIDRSVYDWSADEIHPVHATEATGSGRLE
jgi:hypothetical protein